MRQHDTVFVRVWECNMVEGRETDFERIYASDGDWARLFAASGGYLGTELFRCLGELRRYITAQRPVSDLTSRRVHRR